MITKKYTSSSYTSARLDTTHQMFHVSVQEFKEYVRLSHSWSEFARRCGEKQKFGRFCTSRCVKTLKQKVLFLKLDTQHFTGRARIAARVGEVGQRRLTVWGTSISASLVALKTAVQRRLAELEAGRLSDVPASEL